MDNIIDFSSKIKNLRKNKNITQSELAKMIKSSKTTVSSWERGANKPTVENILAISKACNIPISYFFSDDSEVIYTEKVSLPVYGEVSCGNGLAIFEDTEEFQDVPKEWTTGGSYFCLKAKGDSMLGANVLEGDLLLVREQPIVENGEIAVVIIENQIMLKRVYRENGTFTLVSENSKYPPKKYDPSKDTDIRIVGKLKKAITSF